MSRNSLKLSDTDEVLVQQFLEELRADPVLAAKIILNIDLAPHQRIALRGMWTHPWALHIGGRGTGKSYLNAVCGGLAAALFPEEKVVYVGTGFRQAQIVFGYNEKMVANAPLFEDSIKGGLRGIKHGADQWSIAFKNGSSIQAVPLGSDGSKIRGLRANRLFVDEYVQVPKEIIDGVLIPFMATEKSPLAGYLGIEEGDTANHMVFSSSAYFTFSDGYRRYAEYLKEVYGEHNDRYFVASFNYEDCPEGFINMETVEMARKNTPSAIFRTEWLGEWISDTAGFYPASLVESVASLAVQPELKGVPGAKYVLGVDPASVYNTAGFTVIKLGETNSIVNVDSIGPIKYTEICSSILDYMSRYNIVRIGLDAGAGIPIVNLFQEGRPFVSKDGTTIEMKKLLTLDDVDGGNGQRIIQLMGTSPQAVNEMNYVMKASMEAGQIKWPKGSGDVNDQDFEDRERIMEQVRQLQNEYRMVEAMPNKSGWLSFRVPEHRNKDRYSSSLFALFAAKSYQNEGVEQQIILPSGFWGNAGLHH